MRTCEFCASRLGPMVRADARFCSTRCRVAAHRASAVPAAMKGAARWVRFSSRKVPLTVSGKSASSTDPSTWSTHSAAIKSTAGIGIGFVLGAGIGCIDIDHCIESDGSLLPAAQDILDLCPPTMVEVSPSGTGLHVWGLLAEGPGRVVADCEVYSVGRYITVTGKRFGTTPSVLADLSEVVAML